MDFQQKLLDITEKNHSILCIGLDIDRDKIPRFLFNSCGDPFFEFNRSIIDYTKDLVCAYKLNMAFYEVLGKKGMEVLEKTIRYIPDNIVVILDGKRNDIGNTARKYAQSVFETFHADAATINPYLGIDGVIPFLEYKGRCSFILCRTSNPSAVEFQDLKISKTPLYQIIAMKIKEWNHFGSCGAVVGATYPKELKKIRSILGEDIPILIPGVGKQGGDVENAVKNGTNKDGEMAIINSSRSIIFAGDKEDFAERSREKAMLLRDEINRYRR
ncbi:MAG: orotidine-5'-phosphate decarboxylase [Thermoplasmata archaeon]|nr:MAG: orotidine-5'-phosphate decarboxylase [Thermoplasmata archaeon]RLF37129.1 MAG: orotidine-5'-phosphate decarboxylase [Thermoplasmata archaeon]